ncbi:DUF2516 family protein [Corynebacterium choanae]|uniref:DUF2516 domain-containing protein n=1 Tax=Corynebacterium choanae TaxID=1862358 RepID=A0A3G6J947_9CORY|nr:DUF2516 family protein [Corynebacterium choanae]AZA14516.1 hypothetical protein CCHOA_10685 [Corynebacterium choanae]
MISWLQAIGPLGLIILALHLAITLAGIVGATQIAFTRDDAFTAADRKPKWQWFAMVALSTLAVVSQIWLLSIVGVVIIGIYYFDVRPQIKDLLSGNSAY